MVQTRTSSKDNTPSFTTNPKADRLGRLLPGSLACRVELHICEPIGCGPSPGQPLNPRPCPLAVPCRAVGVGTPDHNVRAKRDSLLSDNTREKTVRTLLNGSNGFPVFGECGFRRGVGVQRCRALVLIADHYRSLLAPRSRLSSAPRTSIKHSDPVWREISSETRAGHHGVSASGRLQLEGRRCAGPEKCREPEDDDEESRRKAPDIEFAEQGSETALPTDLPAVVDIYGDVIKTDWHAIRIKANEAEEYEHFSVSGKP